MMLPHPTLAGPVLTHRVRSQIEAAAAALDASAPECAERYPDHIFTKEEAPKIRVSAPTQTRESRVIVEQRYVRWRCRLSGIDV